MQIVEHHQRPELERRVDRAARGAADHGTGARARFSAQMFARWVT